MPKVPVLDQQGRERTLHVPYDATPEQTQAIMQQHGLRPVEVQPRPQSRGPLSDIDDAIKGLQDKAVSGIEGFAGQFLPGPFASGVGMAADLVLPESLIDIGLLAGGGVGGAAAKILGRGGRLLRPLGAAAGAGTAAKATGEDPLLHALLAGATSGAAEIGAGAVGAARKLRPTQRLQKGDVEEVAGAMTRSTVDRTPGVSGGIRVPADVNEMTRLAGKRTGDSIERQANEMFGLKLDAIEQITGGRRFAIPGFDDPVTVREAYDAVANLSQRAFKEGAKRGTMGANQASLTRAKVLDNIDAALRRSGMGDAADILKGARGDMARQMTVHRLLRGKDVLQEGRVNMEALQRHFKKMSDEGKIAPDAYEDLRRAIFRGEEDISKTDLPGAIKLPFVGTFGRQAKDEVNILRRPRAVGTDPRVKAATKAPSGAKASVGAAYGAERLVEWQPGQPKGADDKVRVRELQKKLKESGYDPGPIDGIMGPRTKRALDAYTLGADHRETIKGAAKDVGVDEKLMLAIGKVESDYNPHAKGKAGEIGMLQMMPATAKGLGYDPKRLIGDPFTQAEASAKLLKRLWSKFSGDRDKVIAAYNAGPGNVFKAVRLARERGGDWRDYLPKGKGYDAKQYLQRVSSAYGSGRTRVASKPFNPPRRRA